jgi:hypothetical protein
MNGIRQARWAGVLLAIGLLTAACSSSSPSPGVASAPSSGTAGHTGSASPSQSASSSGMAVGIAYAQCMRSHGVSAFPDPHAGPNGQGAGWLLPASVNMASPQFQAATKACGPMPNLGGSSVPPLTAAQQQQYLRWAACIRAHGVPGFKDPTFPNGYPQFTTSGDGAQMQAAQQACASYLRGIPGADSGTLTSGGGQ